MTNIELERLKMYQDSFKHMMTFSSAAIVLASAVTGAVLPKPKNLELVTLLAFSNYNFFLRFLLWASLIPTYFGLALFALFAVINVTL